MLLADDVDAEGSGVVLNLASQEYWAAVAGQLPAGVRVIDVDFREPGPDGPRFVSFHAKKARGMMARWLCEHRIDRDRGDEGLRQRRLRLRRRPRATADRWRFARA